MMEWQPIETAPKDGTRIVLGRRDWDVFPAAYWGDIDGDEGAFGAWLFVNDFCTGLPGETGTELGWSEDIEAGWMPTHWMPLPEAPK